ncbi:MAG: hypothetical protein M3032_06645 [Verrucomicrobiota bacterium]|nr:hypothetical protein [Verrucomicrobiota bacterium]
MPFPGESEHEADKLSELELYWANRLTYPTGKFDPAWVRAAAIENEKLTTDVPEGSFERFNVALRKGANPLALPTNTWTALGPQPERMTGCTGCYDYTKTAGRVNQIAVDQTTSTNGSIVAYAATVGGGVWKTTNCCGAGTTWTVTTDDPLIATTAIDDLVIDPNNRNTIYAGTGDLNYGSFSMGSQGILKSTDAGATWKLLGGDVFGPELLAPPGQFSQYDAVGKVRVDPNNSNNVVAGTKRGLFFSYDGGITWKGPYLTNNFSTQRQDITGLELTNIGGVTRIVAAVGVRGFATPVQPTLGANGANGLYIATMPAEGDAPAFTAVSRNDNGFVYGAATAGSASYATGALLNATSGVPYSNITTGNQVGRIDIAVAPSNPNVIYAQVQSIAPNSDSGCGNAAGCQLGAFFTNDGGATWTFMAGSQGGALRQCNSTGPANSATSAGDYPQNWYDQHVEVDPNDASRVFFDTHEIWMATQNGNTWYDTSCVYTQSTAIGVHADQHCLTFIPGSSSMLLAGNDGGVLFSSDINTTALNTKRPTWLNLDDTLNTIEFYAGDISGNFANSSLAQAVGGAQDNGPSSVSFNSTPTGPAQWQMGLGGDGFSGQLQTFESQAQGTITVATFGVAGQTFPVGSQTFTWAATRTTTGTVAIGTTAATAATNIRTAVNADIPSQATAGGTGGNVIVVATTPGASGNSITFKNNDSANLTFNGSGTLGATIAGGQPQNIFWEGNNSGGLSRCTFNCTVGGASWASSRGPWTGDQQQFSLPVNLFHGGIPGGDDCSPNSPSPGCGHMLAGTTRVWETVSGTLATVPTSAWYPTTPATTACSGGANPCLTKGTLGNRSYINMVKYSPKYYSVAIVGTNDGNVQIGFNLGTGVANQANWVDVTGGNAVLPNRPVLGISLDPTASAANLPVGYAAVGGFNANTPSTPGHLYQVTCTANCASFTWQNKTGNLPDIPVDAVISNPNNAKQVFAGTDWGVYFTNDITATTPVWTRFNVGMPHTMVWDFQIDRGSTTLSAWTRGRGAWVFPLPAADISLSAPALLSAVSRKTHGPTGTFNLPLALSGPATVEPRSDGTGKHTIVMTFSEAVNSGSATASPATVDNVTYSGNDMIVNLSNVSDAQTITVNATNISGPNTGTTPAASVKMSVLRADANGDGMVNAADSTTVRGRSGQVLDANNFTSDVNVDGFINVGDTIVVRNNAGHMLPGSMAAAKQTVSESK